VNFNRSFYDEAQVADRIDAYLAILHSLARDAGRTAGHTVQ
jgi:hypothetical protein